MTASSIKRECDKEANAVPMGKVFNITGLCIPREHFMADISGKIEQILAMAVRGDYFTINRPRQYGKTTALFLLSERLRSEKDFLMIETSFEGIDSPTYRDHGRFIKNFLELLKNELEFRQEHELVEIINNCKSITSFGELNSFLGELISRSGRKVILVIDEVDKAGNNQLFLDFLGMLRSKYLDKKKGKGQTFHSVILAGVHDVKTLKNKIRPEEEKTYNSPWNIAVDFKIDMELSAGEITAMLKDYQEERGITIDIPYFVEKLLYYTSGYPFLVSLLCKIMAEDILPGKNRKIWQPGDLNAAVQAALKTNTTNFDTLFKNLENNPELYELVFQLIMNQKEFSYNLHSPLIHFGTIHGILRGENDKAIVHNLLYEQLIYNYMASKMEISEAASFDYTSSTFYDEKGDLKIEQIIRNFQAFMKEQYSARDNKFIERNGRLLFLAYLRPIINGRGFDFKEVQVSEEKRLDVVVTFHHRKYIIELKIWRGEAYHRAGIAQLCDYLEKQDEKTGYLVIFDLRKESGKQGEWKRISSRGKSIFTAWV